jgi:hypothetical protein
VGQLCGLVGTCSMGQSSSLHSINGVNDYDDRDTLSASNRILTTTIDAATTVDSVTGEPLANISILPDVVIDMIGQLLSTRERLLQLERTCRSFYHASNRGNGWGDTLDVSFLPNPAFQFMDILTFLGLSRRLRHHSKILHLKTSRASLTPSLFYSMPSYSSMVSSTELSSMRGAGSSRAQFLWPNVKSLELCTSSTVSQHDTCWRGLLAMTSLRSLTIRAVSESGHQKITLPTLPNIRQLAVISPRRSFHFTIIMDHMPRLQQLHVGHGIYMYGAIDQQTMRERFQCPHIEELSIGNSTMNLQALISSCAPRLRALHLHHLHYNDLKYAVDALTKPGSPLPSPPLTAPISSSTTFATALQSLATSKLPPPSITASPSRMRRGSCSTDDDEIISESPLLTSMPLIAAIFDRKLPPLLELPPPSPVPPSPLPPPLSIHGYAGLTSLSYHQMGNNDTLTDHLSQIAKLTSLRHLSLPCRPAFDGNVYSPLTDDWMQLSSLQQLESLDTSNWDDASMIPLITHLTSSQLRRSPLPSPLPSPPSSSLPASSSFKSKEEEIQSWTTNKLSISLTPLPLPEPVYTYTGNGSLTFVNGITCSIWLKNQTSKE